MRLLLLSNGYPPQRWAGTETYTASIAEELQRRGHRVQVLCAGTWDRGDENLNGHVDEEVNSVPVRRLSINWQRALDPFVYLYNNPVIARHLVQYLAQNRPDVVHVTSCENLSASVLRVAKDAGLPLVVTLTDFWFLCPRMTLLRSDGANCSGVTTPWECLNCQMAGSRVDRMSRRILPERVLPTFFAAVSQYPVLTRQRGLRGWVGDMGARKRFLSQAITWPDVRLTASRFVRDLFVANQVSAPIRLLPYGHDLSWLNGHSGKTESELLRIGFIGQIAPAKGVHVLIKAVTSLGERYQDRLCLVIYGNTQHNLAYANELFELAGGRPNIQFRGTFAHGDMGAVLAGVDVLVVPSMWYDFPLIIHEAFATQTPVIATNLGGMAEAVSPEVDGCLFEPGNALDLAQKLERLIDEPGLLDRLRNGISPVKRIGEHVAELEEVYADLVARRA